MDTSWGTHCLFECHGCDVVCAILTKEKFDSVVGPLAKLSQDDLKYVKNLAKQKLPKQKKKTSIFFVLHMRSDRYKLLSLKRFSKQKIKMLGKEAQFGHMPGLLVVAILHNPLDEESARFCAASVVIALEDLHNVSAWVRAVESTIDACVRVGCQHYTSSTALPQILRDRGMLRALGCPF
ncbi:hypothetical protein RND71_028378 [Anisodus tanguticus]|uniref:Uncharacterized protein n=1 Tax=Anisodus tanguticus TaxID=243964 RepID=A0AAE1RJP2_9SOLA|nr:hypothetical protein RND71_028378 [Anisodus tanguticus]